MAARATLRSAVARRTDGACAPAPGWSPPRRRSQEWPHLDLPIADLRRLGGELERRIQIGGLPHPDASEVLLRLYERPVAEHRLLAPVVDDRGRVGVRESARENPVALGDQSFVERADGRLPVGAAGIALVIDHGNQVLHLKIISCGVKTAWFGGQGLQAVAYCGRPAGRETWIVTPFESTRDSTRSSARSGPVSGNSLAPWPRITGITIRVISSTRSFSSSHRVRAPLPCTCSSPPGLAFSSLIAAARSPRRTVVSSQRVAVSVVEATYLGASFKATPMGCARIWSIDPQEPANSS